MLLFSSWDRPSFRAEGNPPAAPISTIASLFKAFKFRRRDRERSDPQTSVNPKKSIPNTPHRPEIRVLSLVSHVPIGPARNPPPLPPKALEPSSRFERDFSSLNEVAEPSSSLAYLGDDGIPGFKSNDRERERQRNPPPGQQTRPGLSGQISSSTRPFQNVEPHMTYNNSAHALGEAMINHPGTMRQNARKVLRTDVALPLVKGAALAKTIPLAIHGLAIDAERNTSAQDSAVLSESGSPLSAHSSSLSSPNPMALKVGDSPNPPQPFFTHPPIDPSSIPVVASSIYEGDIPTSGIADQEGNEPPPQDGNTPRLESGPSVGSFMALKSRWSSTTNYTTEEEDSPSFLKSFKFRRSNKANRDRQISRKAKKPSLNQTNTSKAWVLPSFSRGSTGSSRIPPPSPPKGFRSSQYGSPSTNNLAESFDHPLNSGGRRAPNPKFNNRHGPSQRDPPPGHQLPVRLDSKVDISRRKVSFIQSGGSARPQVMFDRRHRAPVEALDAQGAMRQNARMSSRTDLTLPTVQAAIRAKSTPLGIPNRTVDTKQDTSTKGSATLSKSDCLPTARLPSSPKAITLKTDEGCNDPKSISADLPICPHCHPCIAVCVCQGEEWSSELPPQDDSDDTPRLATGPSLKSLVSLRNRRSSSTSSDSEEEAFGRDRRVATNQGDEELERAARKPPLQSSCPPDI